MPKGVEVVSLGVAPTPMVAFEAQRLGALGAVVSASHNPYHDNGIKLFALGGLKLTDDVEQRIETELESILRGGRSRGAAPMPDDGDHRPYVDHVLRYLEGRRLDGLRVVLDAANGAASVVGPRGAARRRRGGDRDRGCTRWAQHQRRMWRDRAVVRCCGGAASTAPTSAWHSTVTPTA